LIRKDIKIRIEEIAMTTPAIATVVKMMESLPEPLQDRMVEHLQEYFEDLQDELRWSAAFDKTQAQLVASAQRAKQEIAQGLALPLALERL
jgi:hypothetical protein